MLCVLYTKVLYVYLIRLNLSFQFFFLCEFVLAPLIVIVTRDFLLLMLQLSSLLHYIVGLLYLCVCVRVSNKKKRIKKQKKKRQSKRMTGSIASANE